MSAPNFRMLRYYWRVYVNAASLLMALRNPRAAWRLLSRALSDYSQLGGSVGVTRAQFKAYMAEFARDRAFNDRIWNGIGAFDASLRHRGIMGGGGAMAPDQCRVMYALVRALKPSIVVETGVASGVSSCYVLKALEDNGQGELFSIDLPYALPSASSIPTPPIPQGAQPGWLIPLELRDRWHLIVGRSSQVLPDLLKELGQIDVFLHDSEHTYETQMFEYETAWPYLRGGGLLLSDDSGATPAFSEFACKAGCTSFLYGGRFGVLVKPTG